MVRIFTVSAVLMASACAAWAQPSRQAVDYFRGVLRHSHAHDRQDRALGRRRLSAHRGAAARHRRHRDPAGEGSRGLCRRPGQSIAFLHAQHRDCLHRHAAGFVEQYPRARRRRSGLCRNQPRSANQLATVTRPIQAWYTTQTRDLRGMSRIDSALRQGEGVAMPCFTCGPGRRRNRISARRHLCQRHGKSYR